jgi:hypothetical protein
MSLLLLFAGPLNIPAAPPPPPNTGWGGEGVIGVMALGGHADTSELGSDIEVDGNKGESVLQSLGESTGIVNVGRGKVTIQ